MYGVHFPSNIHTEIKAYKKEKHLFRFGMILSYV